MFVRPLTPEERDQLQGGIRATNGFVLRRCQIILASSQGQTPAQIAPSVGRTPQGVRNVIHAFNQQGLACLEQQSNRPQRLRTLLDDASLEALRDLLHQSPRAFDKPTSLWTLELAAQVSFAEGLTPYKVSTETIRQALNRLGNNWKRAKHWINSPDPEYQQKKGAGPANPPGRNSPGVGGGLSG
ncbi:MAG TPA: helix-turn-helix domain-containing protein [Dehalococcoidia bacterium]|nr:helix-turn-helix domain-containing protein [Dehalococcoidia bacterium]